MSEKIDQQCSKEVKEAINELYPWVFDSTKSAAEPVSMGSMLSFLALSKEQCGEFNKIVKQNAADLHLLAKFQNYLGQTCYIQAVIILEGFLCRYIKLLYQHNPGALSPKDKEQDRAIPVVDLIDIQDREQLLDVIISRRLANIKNDLPLNAGPHLKRFGIKGRSIATKGKKCSGMVKNRHDLVHEYELDEDAFTPTNFLDHLRELNDVFSAFEDYIDTVHLETTKQLFLGKGNTTSKS
jgi:hypothetical protein